MRAARPKNPGLTPGEFMAMTRGDRMATTLVDGNILLDRLTEEGEWSDWSAAMLVQATDSGALVINQVVFSTMRI